MGHSQAQKAETRQRILDAASRRLREAGLGSVPIADLMTGAGLTQGGFYKHFRSKDEFLVAAVEQAIFDSRIDGGRSDLHTFVDHYLGEEHRDSASSGCAFAAFASDMAHASEPARRMFTSQLNLVFADLASLAAEEGEAPDVDAAIARFSTLVGALTLARAVDDPQLSTAILESARCRAKQVS